MSATISPVSATISPEQKAMTGFSRNIPLSSRSPIISIDTRKKLYYYTYNCTHAMGYFCLMGKIPNIDPLQMPSLPQSQRLQMLG